MGEPDGDGDGVRDKSKTPAAASRAGVSLAFPEGFEPSSLP